MTMTLKTPKPRNPFVAASLNRLAGAHRRSEKTRRQATARELRAEAFERHEKP